MENLGGAGRSGSDGLSAARAYELVRRELLTEFGANFFGAYIDQLRLLAEWEGKLLFRAGSATARERIRLQAQHRLEARMRAYLPDLGPIEILLDQEIPEAVRMLADQRIENVRTPRPAQTVHPLSYTFDTFCVDDTNHRAFGVAQMIAAGDGMAFPIFLVHSRPGCGKTHLLNAITHEAAIRTPERKVRLTTGQSFLEAFQAALKKHDPGEFKAMVRAPKLLLIDDFQCITGKKATEEEAWSTINDIVLHGGQVVIAADHGPEGMHGLSQVLLSKLKGATTCEIIEPGQALRRRILEMRVAHYARVMPGFAVKPDALDFIAEHMHVSGRELDGAVSQLVIEAHIAGGNEVTLEVATTALQAKLSDPRITVQQVQKIVARYYGMTPQQLLERTRRKAVARPRQIAMHLATKLTKASLPDIGQRFGGYDHTTVLYARDRIVELAATDAKLRTDLDSLERAISREGLSPTRP